MELRHPRLVDAQLVADLLHGDFAIVVERDHAPLTRRQRLDGLAHARLDLGTLVGVIGTLRFRGDHHRGQLGLVHVLATRDGRCGLNRVNAHDGLAESLFVDANRLGQVRHRWLVTQRAA